MCVPVCFDTESAGMVNLNLQNYSLRSPSLKPLLISGHGCSSLCANKTHLSMLSS